MVQEMRNELIDKGLELSDGFKHLQEILRMKEKHVDDFANAAGAKINKVCDSLLIHNFYEHVNRTIELEQKINAIIDHLGIILNKHDGYVVEEK